ncbi:hypothetical protein CDL12_22163 [Handroanthus impetiginosus]|uniref:Transcription factor CBF/NF-Y/archaeal histone domain-containing protein n=1 Tax=Handroanthus impetiginosus TaxID=429701 RepID=A0A2G9GJ42_9LAMI|nr:hypothetical protein CDL12_22163 [Handroanthus impetiginosus]
MPITKVIKTIYRALSAHANIDDDAKYAIQKCISEFIPFITTWDNKQRHQDSSSTITAMDVLSIMNILKFVYYIKLTLLLNNYRAQDLNIALCNMGYFCGTS